MSNHRDENQEQSHKVLEKTKQLAAKQAKKVGKKVAKQAVKAAAKAAGKAALAAAKAGIAALAAALGPFLLIILGIILLIIIVYAAITLVISKGDEEVLGAEGAKYKTELIEISNSTVDMSDPLQAPYAVPYELLVAILQIQESVETEKESIQLAKEVAEKLKPTLNIETVDEYTESYTTSCDHTGCSSSPINKVVTPLRYISSGETWNGTITSEVSGELSAWTSSSSSYSYAYLNEDGKEVSGTGTTTTYTRNYTYEINEIFTETYSYIESILMSEPFNFKRDDILMVEALYNLTGGNMNYSGQAGASMLGQGYGMDINVLPGSNVPAEYMQYYLSGQKAYNVDWFYIAAIHYTETKFSTHQPMISSVGAEGHTQWMPCSWIGWNYPGCKGTKGYVNVSTEIKEDVSIIAKYGGYGVDADGDGKASMWSLPDSIMATAKYLSKNGFSTNVDKAIKAYNHSQVYVDNVKAKAMEFKNAATYLASGGTGTVSNEGFVAPTTGRITSSWGGRYLPGQGQDFHAALDIANNVGTRIVAVAGGTVKRVQTGCPQNGYIGSTCGWGWGNHISIISNVNGKQYEIIYAHLANVNVTTGATVSQGQIIGLMGNSGSSTGPHLHIEMHTPTRVKGNPPTSVLNPLYYLPPIQPN